ncbi:MAG: gamma-glutamyl-gamma-aminobutyrate hydrolase family protein [Desulfobacterales bacterium]
MDYAVQTIRELMGYKPMFGICLGIQLLDACLGGRTYKLAEIRPSRRQPAGAEPENPAGGGNLQNHGFAVDLDSLDPTANEVTHMNLNDHTVEGFRHRKYPLFAVRYIIQAAPSPHDADYLLPNL